MDTLINDIMGPPRRRSRHTTKPSVGGSPPVQRKSSEELSRKTSEVPTQVTLPRKTLPGSFDNGLATPGPKTPSELVSPTAIPLPPEEPSETLALQEAASSDIPAPAELPPDAEVAQEEGASRTENVPPDGVTAQVEEETAAKELPPEGSVTLGEGNPGPEEELLAAPALTILEPTPVIHSHPAILIGIAGATASGKTVLSQLLSSALPPSTPSFVIHQNDFFIPKHFLYPSKSGEVDTDCSAAIDFAAMIRVLKYAKREGTLPPGYHSEHHHGDERETAETMVVQEVVDELQELLASSGTLPQGQPVGIVSGFLLYHDPDTREILDIKLFLRAKEEAARTKRFKKPAYDAEGAEYNFWRTQHYFEKIVWPNYVHEHRPLFENGNVEGRPLFDLCDKLDIIMQPQLDMTAEHMLRWAASSIPSTLSGRKERVSEHIRDLEQDRGPDPEVSFLRKYEACDCSDGWLGRVRKVLYDIV